MTKKRKKNKPKIKPKLRSKNKEKSEVEEVNLDLPTGLKILCILSFIGFIWTLTFDAADYMAFSNVEEMKVSNDQASWELMEDRLIGFEKAGIDVSKEGTERFVLMYALRSILNVLAMVGTALMFIRVRKGFYFYAIFQFLYVFTPIFMFGIASFAIFDKGSFMIPLIYVALFTSQTKHLTR